MRRSALGTVLVGGLLAAGGCSSAESPSANPPAAGATATSVTSSGTAASTSTPAPTTVTSTRAPDQLQAALLGAAEVPQSWTVYPSTPATGATATAAATSSDPKCAGFLTSVQDPPNPLPPNQAHVEFDGGSLKPPYVAESLEAYPDTSAAAAALKTQQQSAAACPSVTYTVEGKSSPVAVSQEEPPALAVPAFGIRLTATTGGLQGYDARVVNAQVGDTVVSLTFLSATPDQAAGLSKAAVTKAAGVLKTG